MAVALSPSNPGVIYDPRMRASQNYLQSVQSDLDSQAREIGLSIPGNREVYESRWQPMPDNLFTPDGKPNQALQGFAPGRTTGYTGVVGVLGGMRRIG